MCSHQSTADTCVSPVPDAPAEGETMYMVVGFEVSPCSIKRTAGKPVDNVACDNDSPLQEIKEGEKIVYTYDVYWKESNTRWASRWDAYLRMPGGKVHWFSILNSLLIVLVMATLVAMILIRTIRRDLARYEQLVVEGSVDMKEESGWKLLTGDAFRSPVNSKNLCVQVSCCDFSQHCLLQMSIVLKHLIAYLFMLQQVWCNWAVHHHQTSHDVRLPKALGSCCLSGSLFLCRLALASKSFVWHL